MRHRKRYLSFLNILRIMKRTKISNGFYPNEEKTYVKKNPLSFLMSRLIFMKSQLEKNSLSACLFLSSL